MKKNDILKYYKEWGYIPTIEYLRELSINGKFKALSRFDINFLKPYDYFKKWL